MRDLEVYLFDQLSRMWFKDDLLKRPEKVEVDLKETESFIFRRQLYNGRTRLLLIKTEP